MKQVRSLPQPPFYVPATYAWYVFRGLKKDDEFPSPLLDEYMLLNRMVTAWDPTALWEWKVQREHLLQYATALNTK